MAVRDTSQCAGLAAKPSLFADVTAAAVRRARSGAYRGEYGSDADYRPVGRAWGSLIIVRTVS